MLFDAPLAVEATDGLSPSPHCCAPTQVVLDTAGQVGELAVTEERPSGVTDALDQVPVVRDDHHGARPAVEQIFELLKRVDVEIVGRLVEKQDVGLGHEDTRQLQTSALTTGEITDWGALTRRREAQPLSQLTRRYFLVSQRDSLGYILDRVEYAHVGR